MYNKKLLITTLKNLDKTQVPAKKKDIDYNSKMGYRDDSPFRKKKSMNISTENGTIDMSNTGIPIVANGRILPPYSGTHQFDTNVVTEVPLVEAKKGGSKLYSSNLQATNRIFAKNKLFKKNPLLEKNKLFKKKNYKKKIYDPQSMYFQDGGDVSPVQIVPTYIPGVSPGSPEEWAEKIKAAETQIGPPTQWLPEDYNYIQNILQDYYVWRQQNPNAAPADKTKNAMSDYMVPIPYHLRDVVEQKEFPEIPVKKEAEIADVVTGTETLCLDEGRCLETDQIQEMLDRGRDIPKDALDNAWNVIGQVYPEEGQGISAATAWKNLGVPTLGSRLGMTDPANCMWAAGSGWMCEPEFKDVSKTAFESNDKFINAVNKGTVPFTRVSKTNDPNFDSKEKGLLQPGDIINLKGAGTSHAMTFSHYREDGTPIYVDSNGKATDFDWNAGIWSGMKPNKSRTAYVSRFTPELLYGDKIKMLEEKARTNPTYIEAELTQEDINKYVKGGYVVEEISDPSIPRLNRMQGGGPTAEVPDVPVSVEELCGEGYAWDSESQQCVPLPDMKQWFTNWYQNRVLPFDEIGIPKYTALMSKRLQKYNPKTVMQEDIDNLPDPEFVPMIADDPNVMGVVLQGPFEEPIGYQVKHDLKGDVKELGATQAHELSTYLDLPYKEKQFPLQNQIITPGLVSFDERWGDLEGEDRANALAAYNYQTNPNEDNIHSLIFEERYKRDLKPDQTITEADIESWKKEAESNGSLDRNNPNFDHTLYTLFKLAKDNKALANWFNQLASNDKPKDENAPQYAKQGGSTGYQLGDEVDEATMKKLKKLGYTFNKM